MGELAAGHPVQCLVQGDQLFVDQLRGDAECGSRGAFTDSGLQHPQFAALDGELDVAQIAVVGLQPPHHMSELVMRSRVQLRQVVQAQRVPDTGDHVLSLSVGQVVAVGTGAARCRVTGERDTGAAGVAEVAEHHRADVDGGAQVLRDPFPPAVQLRPVGVPGVEHRPHREVQLLAGMLRER